MAKNVSYDFDFQALVQSNGIVHHWYLQERRCLYVAMDRRFSKGGPPNSVDSSLMSPGHPTSKCDVPISTDHIFWGIVCLRVAPFSVQHSECIYLCQTFRPSSWRSMRKLQGTTQRSVELSYWTLTSHHVNKRPFRPPGF